LAPVQITYLGYPDTTGVPAMDYRFTDELADPTGEADAFATEQLVRFAPTAWTYAPPAHAPAVEPPPVLKKGHVTLGCFNNPAKLSDTTVRLWARVLGALPEARLRLKGKALGTAAVRARLLARFAAAGVPEDRLELVEPTRSLPEHLAAYGEVDLALDPFPYHGTTTTCEALWMGVPVVSLIGDRHQCRVGRSLLAAAGHADWSATTEEDYIAAVVRLAGDPAGLAKIRSGLREDLQRGPLLDHAGQAERFGRAVRETWVDWCARRERETLLST
jgi:predicted O-linked N-acetylglucosamine transferase (SPINDLY family)